MSKKPVKTTPTHNGVSVAVVAKKFESQLVPLLKWDGRVTDQESYKKAEAVLYKVKELSRAADKEMKDITVPIKRSVKLIESLFRPFQKMVFEWESGVKEKMVTFLDKQEAKADKVAEDFESGKIKKATTLFQKQDDLATTSEFATVRARVVLVITDAKKLPREYLMPNEDLIRTALEDGKKVPGAELKKTKNIAI